MSASYNNAILGPSLRVGVIPSVSLSPNINFGESVTLMDGGLIAQNDSFPLTSDLFYWIGPNGDYVNFRDNYFVNCVWGNRWSGGWYDPINSVWGALPAFFLPPQDSTAPKYGSNPRIVYLQNVGNGIFRSSSFNSTLMYAALTNSFYSTLSGPNAGYSNNFSYAGIGEIICNNVFNSCSQNNYSNTLFSLSIPYGIINLDFKSASYYSNGNLGCPPISPASPSYYWTVTTHYWLGRGRGMVIAPGILNSFTDIISFDGNGQWHRTSTGSNTSFYIGRLWDGFVCINVFTSYRGCVYTTDFITFYPLYDITNTLDFSNMNNFGNNANGINYFMDGFGYSYLANFYQNKNPFNKAAYKIYPAFNFTPLIPDSFFIPSVCGCNRRSNRA